MHYEIYLQVATPVGNPPTAITHGSVIDTVEADSPAEAIQRAGQRGVNVMVTSEMLPPDGRPLRLTWRAEPARRNL